MDWAADPGARWVETPEPDPPLEAVRAAVYALAGSPIEGLSPQLRRARVVQLERLAAVLAAHQLACLEVIDRDGDPQVVEAGSIRAWLREQARLGPGAASARVVLARRLAQRPAIAEALADGAITLRHAEVLTRTVCELAPRLADDTRLAELECTLLTAATHSDPLRLAEACTRIRHQVAPHAVVQAEYDDFQARYLAVSRTLDGMVAVDGLLDPVTGETVLAAVQSLAAPTGPDDARTPRQRRADALGELCRQALTTGRLPASGGERPQVLVTVGLNSLRDRPGSDPGELGWAGPISGELARRIACDATVTRIVLDPASQPLDVGRATRVVGSGLRRALLVRDRHCRYPGCKVPGQWCDAHHLRHWALGGITALRNLVMLCGYHHTRLHLAGERLHLEPDGTVTLTTNPHGREYRHDDHTTGHPTRQVA